MLCRKLRVDKELNFPTLAHLTPGYVGADLGALVREAALTSVNRVLLYKSCDSHLTVSEMALLLKEQSPLTKEELDILAVTESDFKVTLIRRSSYYLYPVRFRECSTFFKERRVCYCA